MTADSRYLHGQLRAQKDRPTASVQYLPLFISQKLIPIRVLCTNKITKYCISPVNAQPNPIQTFFRAERLSRPFGPPPRSHSTVSMPKFGDLCSNWLTMPKPWRNQPLTPSESIRRNVYQIALAKPPKPNPIPAKTVEITPYLLGNRHMSCLYFPAYLWNRVDERSEDMGRRLA